MAHAWICDEIKAKAKIRTWNAIRIHFLENSLKSIRIAL